MKISSSVGPARAWVLQFGYYKSLKRRRYLSKRHFYEEHTSVDAAGDPAEDKLRIESFIKEFAIPYPVLLAGAIGEVPDKLPQLVRFGAYPTTIFLGRDGRVRGIHAGFASSATGEASAELARETKSIIEHLLAEEPAT